MFARPDELELEAGFVRSCLSDELFACGFLFLTVGKKHFRIAEHK